jgi:hypothetical protein
MIVNVAVFTCSICGEASSNICSYCTKDACSNHRCERCKRCSDCCECEVPLSAEEPALPELAVEFVPEPEAIVPEPIAPEPSAPEPFTPEPFAPRTESRFPVYLTAAESSVFVAGSVSSELLEPTDLDNPTDPDENRDPDPAEPRE